MAWTTADLGNLENELLRRVRGEVSFEAGTRALYTMDGSNYRQVPIGVVVPQTKEDVIEAIASCRKFGAPVFSRGAGTSLAGQTCNAAMVIDWSRHLHKIAELNPEERYARVEPGVICDQLRDAAAPFGLTWGPDPATHTHCTFGGMLGNNSCGTHSQMAGKAVDNILEMDVLLYDGTRMTAGWTDTEQIQVYLSREDRVGEIYQKLKSLRERYEALIRARYPQIPRRVSGYNLDELLPGEDGRFNLARALVGTESTCVTILEAKVKLIDGCPKRALVVLGFADIYEAADHTPEVADFGPIGLEGLDEATTKNIEKKRLLQQEYLPLLPKGKGWLLVEFGSSGKAEAAERAHQLADAMRGRRGVDIRVLLDDSDQRKVWTIRESALGANSLIPGEAPLFEGWDDSAVAPEKLGAYLREIARLYEKYQYRTTLYGHFGQGCVHSRSSFDLASAEGIKKWRAFMEEATDLVVRYGGSLSGEHGDGQARGEFLYKMYGPELVQAFREFKAIWDPEGKMNPGKVVDPYRIDENLRLASKPLFIAASTHFPFAEDGSFAEALERCVGVGKCRRPAGQDEQDTMCPSYMVTREEKHSTRGRAHLLWEMTRGEVIRDGWKDENVKEALDLCLSCKGCKGDCPVNVDVATYKAEFLAHYWHGRMRPLHAYAFGWIDKWAKLSAHAPRVANALTQSRMLQSLGKRLLGIASERKIPAFATRTFRAWFEGMKGRAGTGKQAGERTDQRPKVLLWVDTFNNYFRPKTLIAAVDVLDAVGYEVEISNKPLCCGRPLYDYGFLGMAKAYLKSVMESLAQEIKAGTPLVVLEPSCCSVFRDELINLFPEEAKARALSLMTYTLAEFLEKKAPNFCLPKLQREAIVQGHCHHKAIMRMKEEKAIMEKMGLEFELLESGCCGMAGAFGYEKDKYSISMACGERVLLSRVREASHDTLILANGFSCREQIEQATQWQTLHLAEVLQIALREKA